MGKRSFDGETKSLTRYELKLPREKALLFLSETFLPFAPEGFRSPLLVQRGLTVERATHARATNAVMIRMTTAAEGEAPIHIAVWLRWPSGDFIGKQVELDGGGVSEIRVETEQCETKLGLCFPTKLSQWNDQLRVSTTELSRVEINPEIPLEFFALTPPDGFEVAAHELVETGT